VASSVGNGTSTLTVLGLNDSDMAVAVNVMDWQGGFGG